MTLACPQAQYHRPADNVASLWPDTDSVSHGTPNRQTVESLWAALRSVLQI